MNIRFSLQVFWMAALSSILIGCSKSPSEIAFFETAKLNAAEAALTRQDLVKKKKIDPNYKLVQTKLSGLIILQNPDKSLNYLIADNALADKLANPANSNKNVEQLTDWTLAQMICLAESTPEKIVRVDGRDIFVQTANDRWIGRIALNRIILPESGRDVFRSPEGSNFARLKDYKTGKYFWVNFEDGKALDKEERFMVNGKRVVLKPDGEVGGQ